MMNLRLRAVVLHMAENEILGMVNPDTLVRIKETDPNPVIKVFGIGHEGKAHAMWENRFRMMVHYFRDAVVKLFNQLKVGIPVFAGHARNPEERRESIGEVVGRALKEIKGRTHALAAIHLKPKYVKRDFDIASMEATLQFIMDKKGGVQIEEVEKITGVALGNSATEKPAFSGATLLGAMQAFQSKRGGTITMPDLVEVKALIRKGDFEESEIFDLPEEIRDQALRFFIRHAKGREYEGKRDADRKLTETESELKKKTEDLAAAQIEVRVLRRNQLFDELAVTRKLSPEQKTFTRMHLETFKTQSKEKQSIQADLNKFIDGRLKEHQELVRTYGGKADKDDSDEKKGTPSDDRKPDEGGDVKIKDYTDPAQNPAIAGGEAAAKAATEKK